MLPIIDKEQLLQEVHHTFAAFLDHLEMVHTLEHDQEQTPLEYIQQLNQRMGWKGANLNLYERVHAVQNVFPEELETYLNTKAALETNLKVDRVYEPLINIHDKGFGFQSFGVATIMILLKMQLSPTQFPYRISH